MKQLIWGLAWCLALTVSFPKDSWAFEARPLLWQDIWLASQKMDVPFSVMVLLLHQEDGYVGLKSSNANGTFDYGPFQINSCHLRNAAFRRAGITEELLQYDGPTNALAAAWVFKSVLQNSSSIFDAVGRYHSSTPKFKRRYQANFLERAKGFDCVRSVVARANRGAPKVAALGGVR